MSDKDSIFELYIMAESVSDNGINKEIFISLSQVKCFTDDIIIFINDTSKLSVSNIRIVTLYDVKRILEIINSKDKQPKATLT